LQTATNQPQIAIIIPYYKSRYMNETLQSIKQQTNSNFKLYIGDDCSPHDIQPLLQNLDTDFKDRIVYHRFDTNMGSVSLTRQWERCIALTHDEPYLWLFSDDDIMPPDAIERFYNFIEKANTPIDVLRFDLQIVNDDSKIIRNSKAHPPFEKAENFIFRRLNGECISTACEYIFSRKTYQLNKGFVEFPLAWCSDDASWVQFGQQTGIYTIGGNPVSWRMGGFNISSDKNSTYQLKLKASILYLRFIEERYHFSDELKMKMLYGQLNLLNKSVKVKVNFYKQLFRSGIFSRSFLFKQINIRNKHLLSRVVNKLKRTFN